VTVRKAHKLSTILEIVLDEGRNREVRRLLARIGHKVLKLRRIAIGQLRLGNLKPGESRPLLREEIEALYEAAREKRRQSGKPKKIATADKIGPQAQGEIQPIIDHSLAPEDLENDEAFLISGASIPEPPDHESPDAPAFEDRADDDEFDREADSDVPTAAVDLS